MFAAVKLGIFEGARPADYKELPRLLDACVALGLLEKRDGSYVNTPEADKYLRSDSPDSLTGYIHYSNDALYPMWAHLEDAVREGTPRWNQTFGVEGGIFSGYFRTEETKRDFLKGMHGFGRISSPAVAAAFDLEPVSSIDRSWRCKRTFGGGRSRAISANRSTGIRSARSGRSSIRDHRGRLLHRSAAGGGSLQRRPDSARLVGRKDSSAARQDLCGAAGRRRLAGRREAARTPATSRRTCNR